MFNFDTNKFFDLNIFFLNLRQIYFVIFTITFRNFDNFDLYYSVLPLDLSNCQMPNMYKATKLYILYVQSSKKDGILLTKFLCNFSSSCLRICAERELATIEEGWLCKAPLCGSKKTSQKRMDGFCL